MQQPLNYRARARAQHLLRLGRCGHVVGSALTASALPLRCPFSIHTTTVAMAATTMKPADPATTTGSETATAPPPLLLSVTTTTSFVVSSICFSTTATAPSANCICPAAEEEEAGGEDGVLSCSCSTRLDPALPPPPITDSRRCRPPPSTTLPSTLNQNGRAPESKPLKKSCGNSADICHTLSSSPVGTDSTLASTGSHVPPEQKPCVLPAHASSAHSVTAVTSS